MTHLLRSACAFAMIVACGGALAQTAPVQTAPCGGDFAAWLDGVRTEARAQGVSERAIADGLAGVVIDPKVLALDRGQAVFQQTFLQFASRMVAGQRLTKGPQVIKQNAALFERVRADYGVPASVITAFWGLETDYGANLGKFDTRNALATLSHDCRRPDFFRPQLIAALKIVDRGDLAPADMRGAWAGELGHTQMMPIDYLRDAVDGDGDGKRDLMRSVPDAIMSAGKYLSDMGWKRDEPWLQEVVVPAEMPWVEADIDVKHPVGQWAGWGVKPRNGTLPPDESKAALLLPMGRNGPAFLAYDNFDVYRKWNQSFIYATTAAYLATRFDGAPEVSIGAAPVRPLTTEELHELQRLLAKDGFLTGAPDGKLGGDTRKATRKAQAKLGLPQDGYPTLEVLQALAASGG
ncbi:lytic murein transglycosylase [Methylopila capsulata]|uniref:Lytic murein transglycosylase n=1 Tax=Methylopila capsulata TaxID=61654 RepID=A0A9W6MSN0_9HYPH|nr:lytic murein transglycosylase [Methylopila capsulata]MBM7852237.1 lytic murein transglycosylase [Methylopila capsulata]GLK56444.1 lytic transglycosylase [Methylopila capsulata]